MKLVVGAGGTGGHVIPAIAIALELRSRKWDVQFIGNKNSIEETLSLRYGFAFLPINVQKIYRTFTFKHIQFPYFLTKSIFLALRYMQKYKPDAVLCTGGFVSGPVALASILLNRPLYFQDGNSYPGLTTRLLSGFTRHVFIASDEARTHLSKADCILTGNPILSKVKTEQSSLKWSDINLSPQSRKILIIGGSQGSYIINSTIESCIPDLKKAGLEIIWQTGKKHLEQIRKKLGNQTGIYCFDFTDNLHEFYQVADLAVSRAGALSIAELTEYRIPAVLIPLPTAAGNHQYKNARAYSALGAAVLLEQKNLNADSLVAAVNKILADYDRFCSILSELPQNKATSLISDIIERETVMKETAC
jgi:UDP-N-acetylglucosamine--N-acetylmuramyl-(pentapeptide) pyrophosphoryl-undecaprenol N-acetylglucosamine transferase